MASQGATLVLSEDRDWPGRAWKGRLDLDQSIASQRLTRSHLDIVRHARRSPGGGWSDRSPVADGYIVTPCLRPTRLSEVQFDGRAVAASVAVPAGGLLIYSMQQPYNVEILDPFDAVSFRVPQAALDEQAERLGLPFGTRLSDPFVARTDEVMLALSKALLPALSHPAQVDSLFAEYVFDAAVCHLLHYRGSTRRVASRATPALSPGQLRIAMDLMVDEIGRDMKMSEIAAAGRLSVDRFNHGFRAATGMPPHRWRLRQRTLRAMALLEETSTPLSEIALVCGFADQSHLTRVFNRQIGESPGSWRKNRRK